MSNYREVPKKLLEGLAVRFRSFFNQEYFKNLITLWLLALGILANATNWLILKIFIQPVDFPIILHYNVYFGVDVLGSWKQVYLAPAIGIFIFLTNGALSLHFFKHKERIASHILLLASLIVQLSFLVASLSLVLINY